MGLFNRISSAISSSWNKARNGIGQAVNNVKSGVGNTFNTAKQGLKKGFTAAKDFASKHADTIGNVAAKGLAAGAAALDSYAGVPIGSALAAGAHKLAGKYANDKTGWGRFAKGISQGTALGSQLKSQSNAPDVSNGHIASGYSISSTGNNQYNGRNRKKDWFMG